MNQFKIDFSRGALSSLFITDISDFVTVMAEPLLKEHICNNNFGRDLSEYTAADLHQFIVQGMSEVLAYRYGLSVVGLIPTSKIQERILDAFHNQLTAYLDMNWYCQSFGNFTSQVAFNGQLLFLIPCLIKNTNH